MRPRRIAALLLAIGVWAAPAAAAHNGVGAFFKGPVGGYEAYAYDPYLLPDGATSYRLIVLDGRTLDPIYGVHLRVAATALSDAPARLPRRAVGSVSDYGNVFFYTLPNPYPGHWQVRVTLTGPRGAARATFRVHGLTPAPSGREPAVTVVSSGPTWPVGWVIGGVALLALSAVAVVLLRRRSPTRPAARAG